MQWKEETVTRTIGTKLLLDTNFLVPRKFTRSDNVDFMLLSQFERRPGSDVVSRTLVTLELLDTFSFLLSRNENTRSDIGFLITSCQFEWRPQRDVVSRTLVPCKFIRCDPIHFSFIRET